MTTAEKMTYLQTLVKDQTKSVIRGYGYNGDMYVIALKRLQDSFGNQPKLSPLFYNALIAIRFQLLNNLILPQCTPTF